jgi:outer membrane protein assembly factor BamB
MSRKSCKRHSRYNEPGNILIADQFNNRVIEVTPKGEIVWQFGLGPNDFSQRSIIGTNDSQRVGKNTLMAGTGIPPNTIQQAPNGFADNRVILVNEKKQIIWQYGQFGQTGTGFNLLNTPVQATFVPLEHEHKHHKHHRGILDGTVLITDQANNRIIQVNESKEIIWQFPGPNTNPQDQLNSPNSAEKLKNGNVLIADENNNRAIEVTRKHVVVRVFTASETLGACAFASRLDNGNTLLTDAGNSRAVEVDANDNIVWQYITNAESLSIPAPLPTRALRLRNGDTLISDQFNNRVIRINKTATILAYFGLPLSGQLIPGEGIATNIGYDTRTTQLGLYSPYDAKVIGDYTGITKP